MAARNMQKDLEMFQTVFENDTKTPKSRKKFGKSMKSFNSKT